MKDRYAVRASVSDIALVLFSSLTGSPVATVCVCVYKRFSLLADLLALANIIQTQTACELTLCFSSGLFFSGLLCPLIELCRRLWGQQIHCGEGATRRSDLFDLAMALVSNKLGGNLGYFVRLGAFVQASLTGQIHVFMGKNMCLVRVEALYRG